MRFKIWLKITEDAAGPGSGGGGAPEIEPASQEPENIERLLRLKDFPLGGMDDPIKPRIKSATANYCAMTKGGFMPRKFSRKKMKRI